MGGLFPLISFTIPLISFTKSNDEEGWEEEERERRRGRGAKQESMRSNPILENENPPTGVVGKKTPFKHPLMGVFVSGESCEKSRHKKNTL